MKISIFPQLETEKTMAPKKTVTSKTIWLNALIIASGVATYLQGHELIVTYPAVVSILAVVAGSIGVALRFLTKQPIK